MSFNLVRLDWPWRSTDRGQARQILDRADFDGSLPPAGDTAGDVDASTYERNEFSEINGQCLDLDGFHDGTVRGNRCTNKKSAAEYPHGSFAIVMNNTHPNAHSGNIEISGNTVDGSKFGGLFLMGSGNKITGNQFLRLNLAGCNESNGKFPCIYKSDEPQMLESGIYLDAGASRPEPVRGNIIRDNEISGYKMKTRCIALAPGVSRAGNTIENNSCSDGPAIH